jgi:hypothetical protein
MPQRTRYQERIIRNYYQDRGAIALQRAQELLSELYLTTGKRRAQHWKNLAGHLEALGLKPEQIDHLIAQNNPEVVATVLNKLADKE